MQGLTGALFQWIANFSRMHKFYRLSDMYVPKVSFKNVYDNCRCVFSQREVYEILGVEAIQNNENILCDDFKGGGLEKQMISMFEMQGYMSNQLLRDSDVFGMAHSLEIRTPFVDHKLIELLSKIPDAHKYESNPNKIFLIQSIGDLPSEVYQRQKRGFSLPFKRWIQKDMHDHVKEVLISEPLFNRDFVERELIEFDRGRRHWSRIWSLYILSRWVRKNSNK